MNEFRSVLLRLSQFEANLYHGIPHPCRSSTASWLKRLTRSRTSTRALFGTPVEVQIGGVQQREHARAGAYLRDALHSQS